MSCIIQDGRCHTAPELEFSGDFNISFLYQPPFCGEHKLEGSG